MKFAILSLVASYLDFIYYCIHELSIEFKLAAYYGKLSSTSFYDVTKDKRAYDLSVKFENIEKLIDEMSDDVTRNIMKQKYKALELFSKIRDKFSLTDEEENELLTVTSKIEKVIGDVKTFSTKVRELYSEVKAGIDTINSLRKERYKSMIEEDIITKGSFEKLKSIYDVLLPLIEEYCDRVMSETTMLKVV
ncbi:MAG: hypothetical protein QXK24_09020 [Ignisphaera sp.]